MLAGVLASIGLTCLLKYGTVLAFVRRPLTQYRFFAELFSCSLCLGFWSGVVFAVYFWLITGRAYVLLPLIACASCWLFDSVINCLHTIELYLEGITPSQHRASDTVRQSR